MRKIISTTWPWDHGKMTVAQVVAAAKDLKVDEICIRTPAYYQTYNETWHLQLAQEARAEGIEISLWPVISLYYPEKQADAIKKDYGLFKPVRMVLDAEGKWIIDYIGNLKRFLDSLGRMPCPVGLGSYRRANYHTGMFWESWYKHQVNGKYTIDFLGHQLYPIGWNTPNHWVSQTTLDVDSHEAYITSAGRPSMPWLPWIPTFIGGGFEGMPVPWIPSADAVKAQVEYLTTRLGNRLVGLNFWSMDKNLVDTELAPVYTYVKSLPKEGTTPIPPPSIEPTHDEKVDIMWREMKEHPELFNLEK